VDDNGFGGEINKYIWVQDNCTFSGESGWSIWINEADLDAYENDDYLSTDIYAAAVYGKGKDVTAGKSCYAGSLHYDDDELEWNNREAAYTTVKSVNNPEAQSLTKEDVTDIIKTEITGD
jgi:hypothetical protein